MQQHEGAPKFVARNKLLTIGMKMKKYRIWEYKQKAVKLCKKNKTAAINQRQIWNSNLKCCCKKKTTNEQKIIYVQWVSCQLHLQFSYRSLLQAFPHTLASDFVYVNGYLFTTYVPTLGQVDYFIFLFKDLESHCNVIEWELLHSPPLSWFSETTLRALR